MGKNMDTVETVDTEETTGNETLQDQDGADPELVLYKKR
jgi:hypothetical protein